MGIPDGDYFIISALGENIQVGFLERLPVIHVRGLVDISNIWQIKSFGDPGSNLSTVTLRGGPPYNLVIKDNQLFASTFDPPTPFSIESTGNGKVRFHVPNENSVWKLPATNDPIIITRADGSDNQQWTLVSVPREGAEPVS